jgi:hypothetical protein
MSNFGAKRLSQAQYDRYQYNELSKDESNSTTLKMEAAVPLKHWNEHITVHSVKNQVDCCLN